MEEKQENSVLDKDKKNPEFNIDDFFDFSKNFKKINFRDLLYIGYVRSGEIRISDDLVFECRTLLLDELIKCAEVAAKNSSIEGRNKSYMVEYLVYSIISINNQPLLMDMREIRDFREKYKREPTMEEQARWVLLNKVPPFLVEFLYMIAIKFKNDFDILFLQEIETRIKNVLNERREFTLSNA